MLGLRATTGAPVATQGRSGEESCLDSERPLLNTPALRRRRRSVAAWIRSDYTRATGGCQRRGGVASCLTQTTSEHRACPEEQEEEEEEEPGGSFGLAVTALELQAAA